MTTVLIVKGEEKELEMMVGGIDISQDFIGNTSHGMSSDEEGNYIALQEDFDWWERAIDAHLQMATLIANYKSRFVSDDVDKVVQDSMDVDLDDQPDFVRDGLKNAFGK